MNEIVGIDPGHGWKNTGCVCDKLVERDRVEVTADILARCLEDRGIRSIKTRDRGKNPWFVTRGWRTRKCSAVVSIHINASSDDTTDGMELYYWPGSNRGRCLAEVIARRCPPELLPIGRKAGCRIYAATNKPSAKDDWLQRPRTVLRHHRPPAVLIELGYASNDRNRAYLMSKEGLEEVCWFVALAIDTWLRALARSQSPQ